MKSLLFQKQSKWRKQELSSLSPYLTDLLVWTCTALEQIVSDILASLSLSVVEKWSNKPGHKGRMCYRRAAADTEGEMGSWGKREE